jgi:hypothetical protein
MSITGIEKLEFGVDDLNHCAKFMRDFGLTGDASGRVLPPSAARGSNLTRSDAPTCRQPLKRATPCAV